VLQGKESVYDTDVFEPWLDGVRSLWPLDGPRLRLVCDHLRSSVVVTGDGVRPSNTGRGYVLRRLVRRLLTTLWRDGSDGTDRTLSDLPDEPFGHTLRHFEQESGVDTVRTVLLDEERRFRELVVRGRRVVSRLRSRGPLREEDYGWLHDTHGLPRDLVTGLLSG
jgi:alanyl-tRNA synthetase